MAAADARAGSGGRKGGTAGWSPGRGAAGAQAQASPGCQDPRPPPDAPGARTPGSAPRAVPATSSFCDTGRIEEYFPLFSREPRGGCARGWRDPRLCFPGTCCGSQIETSPLGPGPASQRPGWAGLAARWTRWAGRRGARAPRGCLREGPGGAGRSRASRGADRRLAPSFPPALLSPPLCPPFLSPGRGRVSAARRPGNAADAPRSIPGGGSARVLPAPSRRPAQSQGGGRLGLRGSRRPQPSACPRRVPLSSARRGAAGRRPRARRDWPLLKPERTVAPGRRAAPHPRSARGLGRLPGWLWLCSPGSASLALRPGALPQPALLPRFHYQGCILLTAILSGVRAGEGNWPVVA